MRGRPTCPTEQKKNSVGATGGSPLFYFYKERLGTGSPPHPPQCAHWGTYGLWWLRLDLTEQSPGLFDPQGEGFGRGSFPAGHPILPPNRLTRQGTPRRVSPPAGGERKSNHVLTGSAGQNILLSRQCARRARAAAASPNFGRGLTPSRTLDSPVRYRPERSANLSRPSQNSYNREICVSPRSSGFSSAPAAGRLRAR